MPKWTILELIRNNPNAYKEVLKKRGKDLELADKAHEIDKKYRELLKEVEHLRHEVNKLTDEIKTLSDDSKKKELIEKGKQLKEELKKKEEELDQIEKERIRILYKLPNIIADDVPYGESDDQNLAVYYYGRPKVFKEFEEAFLNQTKGFDVDYTLIDYRPIGHADMAEYVLKLLDTYQAAQVASSRFYYEFNELVLLDFALSLYALEFLRKKGYKITIPPYMIRKDLLFGALDFETFEEMIYKIEDEDLYLIGTAEHALLGMCYKRVLEEDELPIRLAGWSPCFRREAGASGRDTKGAFRVHQFHKVEQFIFCKPDESQELHKELYNNMKELWEGLDIPFRIVVVCTGEMGRAAYKQYDIEAWMPAQGLYREMGSCSNCLDWQGFRANITYAKKDTGERVYVHTLNSTAIAIQRAICAILENCQTEDRVVKIPPVLHKYLKALGFEEKELVPKDQK